MTTVALEPGLFTFLSGEGLLVNDRIYPLTLPQGVTLPASTYQVVSSTPQPVHDWAQDHPLYTGLRLEEARVQLTAYGRTFDEAVEVSNQITAAVTGYRGSWGDVQVESVLPALTLDDYDSDIETWRRITDFYIKWIAGTQSS